MSQRVDHEKAIKLRRIEQAAFELSTRREAVADHQWNAARDAAAVLRPVTELPHGKRANAVREAARKLGLDRATIYRKLATFEGNVSSVLGRSPGPSSGTTRLLPEVREIIARHIEGSYLTRQKPSLSSVVGAIRKACAEELLPVPAYSSIARVLSRYDAIEVAKRRGESDRVQALQVRPGSFDVPEPMAVWQIDHTLLDVIIVSEFDRKPIGRAWLTLIIDVATRMVAGFHLTLSPPQARSVAEALTMAVAAKEHLLDQMGFSGRRWPILGKPFRLHSDNGSEFARSKAYKRGCEDHMIEVVLRPVGRPHYGGHIERLIGSMMGRAKLLPGATFSSPKQRGSYDSAKAAVLTLHELERWLVEQILDYNSRRHSTLGMSPLEAWDRLCAEHKIVPEEVQDLEAFRRDFLPIEGGKIRRKGLVYLTLEYTGPVLDWLKRAGRESAEFRYDPADLSRIYVRDDEGRYHEAVLNYPGSPQVTEWEVRGELKRRRSAREGASNCALTIAGVMRAREAMADGLGGPKRRRQLSRLTEHGIATQPNPAFSSTAEQWRTLLSKGGAND